MTVNADAKPLKAKDFASDQEVRWCPGCGDYAILKAIQKTLADEGVSRENTVFISGIGCSSRFPYYMDTYGFHTIHGRAPAFATGAKLANPDLEVWVISGDGDGLSIGGNHLLHVLRRNVDVNLILFNNEIYGLTKGQYSPTSQVGTRSPSSPMGSVDPPILPVAFALGANARFIARAVDTQMKAQMLPVLQRARQYRGTSFVEIFQNCVVFNDMVFGDFTEKSVANDRQIFVEHGRPMVFGAQKDKGLRLRPGTLEMEVLDLNADGVSIDDCLVHDETDRTLAGVLGAMVPPELPVACGVLLAEPTDSSFHEAVIAQLEQAKASPGPEDLNALFRQGYTWEL